MNAPTPVEGGRRPPVVALAGPALSVLSASFGISAANVALPRISDDLASSFGHAQAVVLGYLLTMTVLSVFAGRVADRIGRGRLLRGSGLVLACAALVAAVAPSIDVLLAARVVQGAGAAAMVSLPLAVAKDTVAPSRSGTAMGLLGTMSAVGTAGGPALGGMLVDWWDWRAVFAVMVPLGLAAAVMTDASAGSRRSVPAPAPVPSGPVRDLPLLVAGAVVNLVVGAVMMTTLVVGPFYLTGALGLDAAVLGLAMAAGPVTSILTGVPLGRLVDRIGSRAAITLGSVIMLLGALALAGLPGWWGLAGYVTAIVVLAPGYQLVLAANGTRVMTAVQPDRRGVASGVLGLAQNLGRVVGTAAMGAVFAAAAGTAVAGASPDALTRAMVVTFLVCAGGLTGVFAVPFVVRLLVSPAGRADAHHRRDRR